MAHICELIDPINRRLRPWRATLLHNGTATEHQRWCFGPHEAALWAISFDEEKLMDWIERAENVRQQLLDMGRRTLHGSVTIPAKHLRDLAEELSATDGATSILAKAAEFPGKAGAV